ncbi:MAG: hypothetical protein VX615_01190 [Planctomycetota bacterium]|nr:hypothetical protein [Planctomycetota bacterium]
MMLRQFQWNTPTPRSTPAKVALFVFGLILFLPILALLLIAGFFASIVFGILMLFGIVTAKIRSLTHKVDEGRKNVRVRR